MSILDNFATEMTRRLTFYVNETTYDPETGETLSNWVMINHAPCPAVVYSKGLAEKYFGAGLWSDAVEYVACLHPLDTEVTTSDRVCVNEDMDLMYSIDSIDDVAYQNEVLLIGLRAVQ